MKILRKLWMTKCIGLLLVLIPFSNTIAHVIPDDGDNIDGHLEELIADHFAPYCIDTRTIGSQAWVIPEICLKHLPGLR